MTIRLATAQDLPAINDIYNQAVLQKFCTAHLSQLGMSYRIKWFKQHDPHRFPVFVALYKEEVVGWLSLGAYRADRHALAHVAEVSYYVDQGFRGQGVGTGLLTYATEHAQDYHFTVLIAILLGKNSASIGLLEKHGFSAWGLLPGIAKIDDIQVDHLYYGLKL